MRNIHVAALPPIEEFGISRGDELFALFETYYYEAKFALLIFAEHLSELSPEVKILEIGSGIGLLSNHLSHLGLKYITSVEPQGPGFNQMNLMRKIVNDHPNYRDNAITHHNCFIEELTSNKKFEFIISFNVMEHVDNLDKVLNHIGNMLEPKGKHVFVCPNYTFPYEGHFNIPIIINKQITGIFFKRKISSFNTADPNGLWRSLNWITPWKIESAITSNYSVKFSRNASALYFARFSDDLVFEKRKGKFFRLASKIAGPIFRIVPAKFQPVIECELRQQSSAKV